MKISEKDREKVFKRIIKDNSGCWIYTGANDILFNGSVTSIRSAIYQIHYNKKNIINKVRESCLKLCINPEHIVSDIHHAERYKPFCIKVENCLTYTGKYKLERVRKAFNEEHKKYAYTSFKRNKDCQGKCVDPEHRIKKGDKNTLFLNLVLKNQSEADCWKYQGPACVRIGNKQTTPRRFSWQIFYKEKPYMLTLKDTCQTWCVNPHHITNKKK